MSREGKLAKNTLILAIGTFFPKVAVFITLPVLTAYMTQAEYGTYDLILTLVSFILPAATLQIQSAAFRFLMDVRSDDKGKTEIITNIYGFIIPTSLVALVVLALCLNKLSLPVRLAICIYFLCDIISNANKQIVRGLSDNVAYAISSFISAVGQILLIFLLVFVIRQGLLGGIIAMAVAEFLSSVFLLFKGKIYQFIKPGFFSTVKIKEMLAYSWPIVPNTFSQSIMHTSDRFVISIVMGVASNGVYAAAYKIPSILAFAQITFNMAWQENATLTAKDADVEEYYSSMFNSLFNIVAGGMAFLIGITPILFRILIKGDYQEGYNQIPILYMGILFYCLSSFWGGIFVAYKKTKVVATTTVIAAMTNLIIDICTMKWIGLYAASISTLVSYLILCLLRLISVQKLLTIKYDIKHIVSILSLLTIECILSFMQQGFLNAINFIFGIALLLTLNWKMILSVLKKISSKKLAK